MSGKEERNITGASAGGIAALDEESFDDAMEDGVIVITFEAELNEIPGGLGRLFGPELHVEGAVSRVQHHFPLRRRLQYIDRRHVCIKGSIM